MNDEIMAQEIPDAPQSDSVESAAPVNHKRGRPRINRVYESNAARQKAYRERKYEREHAAPADT
jgi:hypothetical protein